MSYIELIEQNFAESQAIQQPKLGKPVRYHVILLNDDFTPMDFVVTVLEQFFALPTEQAVEVMLSVHTKGKGICGIYTRDIAETKVYQVTEYARDYDYPLLCSMEAISE